MLRALLDRLAQTAERMGRLLYIDAIGGAAGDMLLAALIDAGADAQRVQRGLAGLGIDGLEVHVDRASRHGLVARTVTVVAPDSQPHRSWTDVKRLLDDAELPAGVRRRAHKVFAVLARAEAKVHGVEPEQVNFHEVGALDALADVCGACLALEALEVEEIQCSPLPVSRGMTAGAHGVLPLPAPATLEILRGAPLYGFEVGAELVTPTGAALIAALSSGFGPVPSIVADVVGYGAGSRELPSIPNVLRVLVGQRTHRSDPARGSDVVIIETNLDDLSPELVPDAVEGSFAAGALDVWITPTQMKKGRSGVILSALARPRDECAVSEAILRETSTLGVRVSGARRLELDRRCITVRVSGEPIRVKLASLYGQNLNVAPEHDDCANVARKTGQAVKAVWVAALVAAQKELDGQPC